MALPRSIGKYQIMRRLGGGGMAEVFAAELTGPEGFARRVALKRVLPGFAHDPAFVAMFTQEAKLSARFDHPNIVSVLDFDRDPEHGLYLTMELVEGRDLAALLRSGALPVPVVCYLVVELLRGLGYAHRLALGAAQGVVHRDVSPQNVLLSWQGEVKVSDFGIAKARIEAMASASISIKGKPAYMSPEQATRQPLDGRSDLFSLGVILWELLVGRPLFHGATLHESFAALFHLAIPSPSLLRPEVPQEVSAIALKLLSRLPADRYATAEDAIDALLACGAAPRDGRRELVALLRERFLARTPALSPACDALSTRIEGARNKPSGHAAVSTEPDESLGSVVVVVEAEAPDTDEAAPIPSTFIHSPVPRGLAVIALAAALAVAVVVIVARSEEPPPKPPPPEVVFEEIVTAVPLPVKEPRPAEPALDPRAAVEPASVVAPLPAVASQPKKGDGPRRPRRRTGPPRKAAAASAGAKSVLLKQAPNALAAP